LQGFLLQIDVAQTVVHEADEPNAVFDLFEAGELTCEQLSSGSPGGACGKRQSTIAWIALTAATLAEDHRPTGCGNWLA
jgi:hypothetical protein